MVRKPADTILRANRADQKSTTNSIHFFLLQSDEQSVSSAISYMQIKYGPCEAPSDSHWGTSSKGYKWLELQDKSLLDWVFLGTFNNCW